MTENPAQQSMVKNMVALAHGLGIMVVAEGVETNEQLRLLESFHCDIAQGYHFAPPNAGGRIRSLG